MHAKTFTQLEQDTDSVSCSIDIMCRHFVQFFGVSFIVDFAIWFGSKRYKDLLGLGMNWSWFELTVVWTGLDVNWVQERLLAIYVNQFTWLR